MIGVFMKLFGTTKFKTRKLCFLQRRGSCDRHLSRGLGNSFVHGFHLRLGIIMFVGALVNVTKFLVVRPALRWFCRGGSKASHGPLHRVYLGSGARLLGWSWLSLTV